MHIITCIEQIKLKYTRGKTAKTGLLNINTVTFKPHVLQKKWRYMENLEISRKGSHLRLLF